jgi:multidrug efflux pump
VNLKPYASGPSPGRGDPPAEARGGRRIHLYLQPVQDLTVDARVSCTQYQYSLEDADAVESAVGRRSWSTLRVSPGAATSQRRTGRRPAGVVAIDRATAARFGISPQVIDDTSTTPSASARCRPSSQLNQYRVVLEVASEFSTPSRLDDIVTGMNAGRSVASDRARPDARP